MEWLREAMLVRENIRCAITAPAASTAFAVVFVFAVACLCCCLSLLLLLPLGPKARFIPAQGNALGS